MASPGLALPTKIKKKSSQGTLAAPSQNDTILCCSKVLHRHILKKDVLNPNKEGETSSPKQEDAFDIDHFIRRTYNVQLPVFSKSFPITVFRQKMRINKLPAPDIGRIYSFIKRICDRVRLNPEIVIIALIYIERLMETDALNLTARNWIPVVSIALLTASKVWDDHCTWNADFATILPLFTLKEINDLERLFLTDLNYMLYISQSDYARYYFGLRALKHQPARAIPKYYLKLNIGGAARVATKTIQPPQAHDSFTVPMSL